jgi:hypothetical protein
VNTLHLVKFPQLLSIATLMIGVSSVSVGAETVNPASPKTNPIPLPGTALTTAAPLMGAPIAIESLPAAQTDETTTTESAKSVPSSPDSLAGLETAASDSTDSVQEPALLTQAQPAAPVETPAPTQTTPGTPTIETTPGTPGPIETTSTIQTPILETDVTPGRATRSGSSYIGIGGNIGIGDGDTAIGEGSFAVLSKIGLTRSFSVRPSFLIGDNVTILLPVTYDFNFGAGPTEDIGFRAAPYVGVGPAISLGDDSGVDLLLTGGIDVPISSQFTATAAVNASVTGNPAVGVFVGVGYNFAGF